MLQQITTQDSLDIFLLTCNAKGLTKASYIFYKAKIKDFLDYTKINLLSGVTTSHIRLYLKHLQDKGLSSHSCHSHARAIRAWLNFCVEDGYIPVSPFNKVSMPKQRKIKPVVLSEVEIKQCIDACNCLRDKLILLMSLDTGLRASELLDLNFDSIVDSRVYVKDGKGQKDRIVFIGRKTILLLAKYRLERHKPDAKDPIFISQLGDRLTVSGLMQLYKRLRKATKLTKLTSHTVRRTALTLMLKSGMSLYHLKEIAGHEDIKTLQYYINVDDDLQNSHSKHGVVDNL